VLGIRNLFDNIENSLWTSVFCNVKKKQRVLRTFARKDDSVARLTLPVCLQQITTLTSFSLLA